MAGQLRVDEITDEAGTGSPSFPVGASIQGLTVGRGAGAIDSNTAVGASALAANTTGLQNTAVGIEALKSNTTASENTAVGRFALRLNTTGFRNSGFGQGALSDNTTGTQNTALGLSALQSNTTASNNTAVGYQAGYSATTSARNVFIGKTAGYNTTTGGFNTFVGEEAGYLNTTGTYNTIVGPQGAGEAMTTGSKNTILGKYNGNQGGLDIRTSSNNIVLSDGDGNPRFFVNNNNGTAFFRTELAFSAGLQVDRLRLYPSTDTGMDVGLPSFRFGTVFASTGTINTSDANAKQDVADLSESERRVAVRVKALVKKFRFKDAVAIKGDDARIHVGVIAQEVQAAFEAEGLDASRYALFCSDTWYEVDGKACEPTTPYTAETPNAVAVTRLGIRYDQLLAFVIAAL